MTISEEQRRQWREEEKHKMKAMLDRAEKYGPNAFSVAANLLTSNLDYDEILAAARKAPASPPTDAVHRGVIRGDAGAMIREPAREAEEAWLRL